MWQSISVFQRSPFALSWSATRFLIARILSPNQWLLRRKRPDRAPYTQSTMLRCSSQQSGEHTGEHTGE